MYPLRFFIKLESRWDSWLLPPELFMLRANPDRFTAAMLFDSSNLLSSPPSDSQLSFAYESNTSLAKICSLILRSWSYFSADSCSSGTPARTS